MGDKLWSNQGTLAEVWTKLKSIIYPLLLVLNLKDKYILISEMFHQVIRTDFKP